MQPAGRAADRAVRADHAHPGHHGEATGTTAAALMLAALGVVFGDIGTSPLYAIKECFNGPHAAPLTHESILGVLSLMFWSLTMVVAVKYLMFVTRADNDGEGGSLALLALVPEKMRRSSKAGGPLVLLVLFGASLLYGDGIITPAISVLSAIEGLEVATSALKPVIVPLTTLIIVALFMAQRKGTAGIGGVFGPVMIVWFGTLGVLGVIQILRTPAVLHALNPVHGVLFLVQHGYHAFLVLGSVVLCVTGGEALYADMGHFGRTAIKRAWFWMVMPSLVLNYFGQGALILDDPAAAASPFYGLVPRWGLYPMVALSTAAAVIASQAMISGAFSITRQAVQLGYFPRVTIVHTSREHEGQIYIPEVNAGMALACLVLVWTFKTSGSLAAAYGIAVTGTMTITSITYFVVVTQTWKWPVWRALPLVAWFLLFDGSFLAANVVKIADGGWVPIAMGLVVFTAMTTWKTGKNRLGAHIAQGAEPLDAFLDQVGEQKPPRVPGTAVFMTASRDGVPIVMRHHYRHNQVLHEQVVLLTIISQDIPFVSPKKRIVVEELREGFFRVTAAFGFMETPRIPAILEACAIFGLAVDPESVTFYLGRETLIATRRPGMATWRKGLFAFMSRNARTATAYFGIPPDRVVELGLQVEL
jgi:KUP system potassium uptake protein